MSGRVLTTFNAERGRVSAARHESASVSMTEGRAGFEGPEMCVVAYTRRGDDGRLKG